MTTVTQLAAKVPMEVEYQPAWLTWVASTTTCLKALGVDCDTADVAALSGYAFTISVHEELCQSGPTMFDWGGLLYGVNCLGRSVKVFQSADCHYTGHTSDRTREHCRIAYEMVAQEISEGRPCVIWGTYVPEFGVAVGVEDGSYIVRSFKEVIGEEQPPIPYDGIEAPGGPYVLAFPSPTEYRQLHADEVAIRNAVSLLHRPRYWSKYGFGLDAYNWWIRALEENVAVDFGSAYNAQCYAQGRRFARAYIKRAAQRCDFAAKPLAKAVEAYEDACEAMDKVAKIFPFPPNKETEDEKKRKAAVKLLKKAKKAEKKAAEALEEAAELDWPRE